MFDILPEARRDAARAALSSAAGPAAVTRLEPIHGGASGALIYRADAGGRAYVLRMETPRDVLRNPDQYTCMTAAAGAGIAPPVRYLDETAGVVVMDFIQGRPLEAFPGGGAGLAQAAGRLAADLQALAPFPARFRYPDMLGYFFSRLHGGGRFASGLLDPHAEALARLREAYPWAASAPVASHNDPNRNNLIFDGTRLWLIDWETAYGADPFVDVAILAENLAPPGPLEDALLQGWLGREADAFERARLAVMRPLTRIYYASLILGMMGGPPPADPDTSLDALTPDEFRAAVMDGRLRLNSPELLYALGKLMLAQFMAGISAPGFADDVARLKAHN